MATKRIAVVGGGISGLAAAWQLSRLVKDNSIKITLIAPGDRQIGGWIRSLRMKGELFEEGPRTLRPVGVPGAATLDMIHALNLQHRIIPISKTCPAATHRFLLYKESLQKLPTSLVSLIFRPPRILRGIIWHLMKDIFVRPSKFPDETIHSFFSRRFSKRVANDLVSAITHGIYAGDAKSLSIRSCFPAIHACDKRSIILSQIFPRKTPTNPAWEYWDSSNLQSASPECKEFINTIQKNCSMYTFEDGLQELSDAVYGQLRMSNVEIKREKCIGLEAKADRVTVELENGEKLQTDYVISAVPAWSLSKALTQGNRDSTAISQITSLLDSVSYVDVAVVNLVYDGDVLPKDLTGFGFLVPQSQIDPNTALLGVIFDSKVTDATSIFPLTSNTIRKSNKVDTTRLTAMIGGHLFPTLSEKAQTEEELLSSAISSVKKYCKIDAEPTMTRVTIVRKGIPQYTLGHEDRMVELRKSLDALGSRIKVVGASYIGVSVNDCVLSGRIAANEVIQSLLTK